MPDLDKWEVILIDVNDQPLAVFESSIDNSTGGPDAGYHLFCKNTAALADGQAFAWLATRNNKLIARNEKIYLNSPRTIVKGSTLYGGPLWIEPEDLITVHIEKVCTCGGWAVYGRDADIHSDTVAFQCDLRRT